jgi:hypothetical protein
MWSDYIKNITLSSICDSSHIQNQCVIEDIGDIRTVGKFPVRGTVWLHPVVTLPMYRHMTGTIWFVTCHLRQVLHDWNCGNHLCFLLCYFKQLNTWDSHTQNICWGFQVVLIKKVGLEMLRV